MFDGGAYQSRFDALAAEGVHIHGEADLVESFHPASVLDAGCGTGRVVIELARRGIEVVGVEVDRSMLTEARRRAPGLEWVEADLADLHLGRDFDAVVLAGNVPLFCPPARRPALVAACAAHVARGGLLIAGFQLDGRYTLAEWDAGCSQAGLDLLERWSTWDRGPWTAASDYAVSVHSRRAASGPEVRPSGSGSAADG
jgi:SAM-dependent methyltransferase